MKLRIATLACLLFASHASASGFDVARFGSDQAHAAAPTPYATYYNPAALSLTRKGELALDVITAIRSASYDRTDTTVAEPRDGRGANLGKSSLTDVLVGPALAASFRIGDLGIGLAAVAPFAGSAHWDGNNSFRGNEKYPGAQDGRARWHVISGTSQTIYLSAGAGYNFRKIGLSLGASANLIYSTLDLTRATTLQLDDALANEGRIHIKGSGWMGSFAVGAMWEILRNKLWLGVSYQAPPGMYDGMTLKGKVRTNFGTVSSVDADLHQTLPDFIRFALRFREPSYELRLSGDYARWSVFDNQCVSQRGAACTINKDGSASESVRETLISSSARNWKDALSLRLGGSYYFKGGWELLGSLGWDGNPVPDSMLEPTYPLGTDVNYQVGGRYRFGKRWALSIAYTGMYFLPRDTTGKSTLDTLMPPGNMPSADGKYTQYISLFNTFAQVYFD
ncbi:MAG TPA: outer membrane protein transport protein [Polyangiales bacterium]|nr:outer membrane protein transport protein [Polyangiales bacterium]